jgi:D-alanine-D-alanine ligase
MQKKIRVAVLYGGRSGEHEVSLRSGASVIRHLDKKRFEVVPIGIDKDGQWRMAPLEVVSNTPDTLKIDASMKEFTFPSRPGALDFDVVFPVMHGTFCEDGTLQGLLELAEVAYVGCGVLASSVGMDKDFSKKLVKEAGVPVAPYLITNLGQWGKNQAAITARVKKEIFYPCFVKPCNSGSSVGIHKVKDEADLAKAMGDAFLYDTKVLIEKAISAREIELSVLENPDYGSDPLISVCGEVTPTHEFYSYEAKYLDENGAALMIPAPLTEQQLQEAQLIAKKVFQALECEGLSRVDLFLDKNTNQFWFNEINTLPGFTSISMYPKMWEASGIGYSELLGKLVDLAIARHQRKQKLSREFVS